MNEKNNPFRVSRQLQPGENLFHVKNVSMLHFVGRVSSLHPEDSMDGTEVLEKLLEAYLLRWLVC